MNIYRLKASQLKAVRRTKSVRSARAPNQVAFSLFRHVEHVEQVLASSLKAVGAQARAVLQTTAICNLFIIHT